ncbi:MAG: hypothetical protein Q8S75_02615 [Nitrospirota bacterium]|nr:hypothetical protein [Nitrospirota bacterium]
MRRMLCAATLILVASSLIPRLSHASDLPGIPPETVANYIHAIIEADRTFYTIHVVERLQRSGAPPPPKTGAPKKMCCRCPRSSSSTPAIWR